MGNKKTGLSAPQEDMSSCAPRKRVTLLHAGEIDRSSLTSIHSPRPNQDRVILIDTPALGLCGDALGLGDSVDSALFVINITG